MDNNYYTLIIQYGGSQKPKVVQFENLTPEGKDFGIWTQGLRQRIYTTGFNLEVAPGSWELISPFRVHHLDLIRQPGKQ